MQPADLGANQLIIGGSMAQSVEDAKKAKAEAVQDMFKYNHKLKWAAKFLSPKWGSWYTDDYHVRHPERGGLTPGLLHFGKGHDPPCEQLTLDDNADSVKMRHIGFQNFDTCYLGLLLKIDDLKDKIDEYYE